MAEKWSEILVKSGKKGLRSFLKVTAHSGCCKISFPFQAKCPLCFIDPYLLSHPPHSLSSQGFPKPKHIGDNRSIQNTIGSVEDCDCAGFSY